MKDRWSYLQEEIEQIKQANLWRFERSLSHHEKHPEILLDGKPVIDFSSNHYLGLGVFAPVQQKLEEASRLGSGSFASRLIGGTTPSHLRLEQEIASFKQTEDSILFGSGFLANAGAIPALAGAEDVIFSDELNHASIVDGCRASRAKVVVYPHRDVVALRGLLQKNQTSRRRLIVTDSIFSMDGDEAPMVELSALAQEFDAFLYVDEAHATGVYGNFGEGLAASVGVVPEVSMGTLSKALGVYGAFIAGKKILCDFLRNKARSYIFTTSLPPILMEAASVALQCSINAHQRRETLWENNRLFREGLQKIGVEVPRESRAPIIPVIVGGSEQTMKASFALLEKGIFAHGIRPPTVPKNTGRLRFTILATHTKEHIERALDAVRSL